MRLTKHYVGQFTIPVVSAILLLASSAGHSQDTGPFVDFAGNWSGAGTVKVSNGNQERIRCKVSYAVQNGGHSLQQDLRCASDSYRFDLSSDVSNRGGAISGQWTESNRRTGGSLSGRVSHNQIEGLVEGSGFSAELSISTRGDRQSVTIKPRGIDISEVGMTLHRGR
jgi:hypothetical protein